MIKRKAKSSKINKIFNNTKKRFQNYLGRRPHRSFRFTRRRDYTRSLKLPKYWQFTLYVNRILWKNKKTFFALVAFYCVLVFLFAGIASQSTFTSLTEILNSTGGDILSGAWGKIGGASLLMASAMTGGMSSGLTDVQQIYVGLITLVTWLTTVWLLRNISAGRKVKMRDGVYNSGAPIIPTFLVALIILIQLLPLALAIIGIGAASISGLLSNGVEAMLFWIAAGLLASVTLYFIIGTLFALVIVTLPGMYPMQAIKASGDMVIGRRVRILFRLIWMALIELVVWSLIMIPLILLDNWLSEIWPIVGQIPIVPVVLLVLTALTTIWTSSYIYLLYRKVVDDEAEPA